MRTMGIPKSLEHQAALKEARNRPEVAAAITAKLKGRVFSEEHRAKLTVARRERAPLTLSDEHKRHIGDYFRGKPLAVEHRAKIGAGNRGRTASPETRAKIRAARLGTKASPEARAKMSAAHLGKPKSPEHLMALRNPAIIGECAYCFGPATSHDHVIPISRGGTDDPGNLVLACKSCNSTKHNRTPDEWLDAILRVAS